MSTKNATLPIKFLSEHPKKIKGGFVPFWLRYSEKNIISLEINLFFYGMIGGRF